MGKKTLVSNSLTQLERNKLVSDHLHVARIYASKHKKAFRSNDSYDEIYQEACLALIRAAEVFQPGRGTTFATYANYWARSAASKVLNRDQYYKHFGYSLNESIKSIFEIVNDGDMSEKQDFLTSLDISVEEEIILLQQASKQSQYLRQAIEQIRTPTSRKMNTALRNRIIDARILAEEPLSGTEVAAEFKCSRANVSQIEIEIRKKLKELVLEEQEGDKQCL